MNRIDEIALRNIILASWCTEIESKASGDEYLIETAERFRKAVEKFAVKHGYDLAALRESIVRQTGSNLASLHFSA